MRQSPGLQRTPGGRDAPRRGATMFDLWGQDRFGSTPPLPRLVLAGVRVAWAAGRPQVKAILMLQAFTMVAVVVEVLVARSLLSGLIRSSRRPCHGRWSGSANRGVGGVGCGPGDRSGGAGLSPAAAQRALHPIWRG
jgi:hypothetical protein